jgi:hypothetical protein
MNSGCSRHMIADAKWFSILSPCFLSLVTHLHALIGLPIPYIPIGLGLWLVDLLSPAVLNYFTSLTSFVMLSLAYGLEL